MDAPDNCTCLKCGAAGSLRGKRVALVVQSVKKGLEPKW